MTIRERFLAVMRRERGGYVPKHVILCPAQLDRFAAEYGHRDVARQWNLPTRTAALDFVPTCRDFSPWLGAIDAHTEVDAWGIGYQAREGAFHFRHILHPLAAAETAEQVREYPLPDVPDASAVAEAARKVQAIHAAGLVAVARTCPAGGTIFWPAYKLRGMETLLCDMYVAEDLLTALLDRITELVARHAALSAKTGADVLHMADDLGTQQSTYMSPADFRRWFKPRLAEVIRAAKAVKPDLLVHFHSDGAIQSLIGDLIEIGVDILNPIQPECMDPLEIKRAYGEQMSFSGCVGTQTTLPFGTPAEVRAKTRLYCERVGAGGGLWIAPTHVVEPEVPWENVLAFVETADEYA